MKKHLYLYFFLLILFPSFALAQGKFMFKHLEVSNGLSHSQVNYIYKDSRGFLWFGTVYGNSTAINVENLSNGLYFMEIKIENKIYKTKFVKE
jgi:ligand-binding sensor domain-containing protein